MRNKIFFEQRHTVWVSACLAALALTGCNSNDNSTQNPSLSGYSQANAPRVTVGTSLGPVMAAENLMTLYTFEKDTVGKSNCNGFEEGQCADIWPPLYAEADALPNGGFSVIQRDDGSDQWAFKGFPLYFYKFDTNSKDVNGENVNNVWFVARPDPVVTGSTDLGNVLTVQGSVPTGDGNPESRKEMDGFSLYTFTVDNPGVSNCNGLEEDECAEIWPPLYADKAARGSGDFSVIERNDETHQWAYKDYPLYFFKKDLEAGDTNGENVNGVWFLARPIPVTTNTTELGTVYTGSGSIRQGDGDPEIRRDFDGFTLYTFANDTANVSNCNGLEEGECADIWPPLYADKEARPSGGFSVIDRADGSKQWALDQAPLYFYKFDEAPGDVNGQEVNNVWFVAKPGI